MKNSRSLHIRTAPDATRDRTPAIALLRRSRSGAAASAEADRLEIIVGLDDLPQALLGGAIAAIGVGVVALHQRLEPRLDLLRGGIRIEAQRVERLALGVARHAVLGWPPRRARAGSFAELVEHPERIVGVGKFRTEAGGMGARRRSAAIHTYLPGRTMPDDRLLLVASDVVGAHPGKEIVRVVVLAHVVEAEPPVLALAQPPLGRTMGRRRLAVRPIAGRALCAQPTVLVGLDPDAVEQGRVVFHDRSVCARDEVTFKS